MDRLADSITLLRGYGAQFWVFVQDLSQLKAVYPRWQSFLANRGHDKSSSQVSGISERTVDIDSTVLPSSAQINGLASLSRIDRLRTDPSALSGK